MTKNVSTNFGQPLSHTSENLVKEVRLKINQPIHPNFDTDFNIYRFVLAAERIFKRERDIVEFASKALNNHLRVRRALKLDYQPEITFDENRLFRDRFLPKGELLKQTDRQNRLLWYVEYKTIDVEALAHFLRSSESIRLQFLQFESMLKRVNKQEEETGRFSGLRHIIDMAGYEINPFTMLFVSDGNLSYYSQLFHFENFPELVSPLEMVNVPKWINLPYQIARTMMPEGFTQRFRLHDDNFLPSLLQDIKIEDIPMTLGGLNAQIVCAPALKQSLLQNAELVDKEFVKSLETIHISPKKVRQIHIDIRESGKRLQWYFITDGDITFGIFFEPFEQTAPSASGDCTPIKHRPEAEMINHDELEMVYPWLRLSAKLVHEKDHIECSTPGRYWIILHNRNSWFHKRTVNLAIQVVDQEADIAKRHYLDGTLSPSTSFLSTVTTK